MTTDPLIIPVPLFVPAVEEPAPAEDAKPDLETAVAFAEELAARVPEAWRAALERKAASMTERQCKAVEECLGISR